MIDRALSILAPTLLAVSACGTGTSGPASTDRAALRPRPSPVLQIRQIGESFEGRPIESVRATRATHPDDVPAILFIGGFHGHEGSERDAWYMARALAAAAPDSEIGGLLERAVVWFVPLVNPDGREREERKNARKVDLNRNFSVHWDDARAADSSRFGGPTPFSEVESSLVRDFASSLPNLRLFVDLHRSAEVLVVPSVAGGERRPDPESFALAKELAPIIDLPSGHARVLHLASEPGLAMDWARTELGVTAFVWESPWEDRPDTGADDPRWKGLVALLRWVSTGHPSESAVDLQGPQ